MCCVRQKFGTEEFHQARHQTSGLIFVMSILVAYKQPNSKANKNLPIKWVEWKLHDLFRISDVEIY